MKVDILTVDLFLPGSTSLKAKRMVLHSLKARLRHSFNVALASVGAVDKWQHATLAIVGVEQEGAAVKKRSVPCRHVSGAF